MSKETQRIKKKKIVRFPTRGKLRPQLSNNQSFSRSLRKERDDSVMLRSAFESVKGNNFQLASSYQSEKLRSAGLFQENADLKKKLIELQAEYSRLKSKAGNKSLHRDTVKNALDTMNERVRKSYSLMLADFTSTRQAMEVVSQSLEITGQSFLKFTEEMEMAKSEFLEIAGDNKSPESFNSSFRTRRASGLIRTPRQRVLPMVAGMQISTMPSVRIPRLNPTIVHDTVEISDEESSSDSGDESMNYALNATQRRRASGLFQPRRAVPAPVPRRAPPIVSSAPRVSIVPESASSSENSPEQSQNSHIRQESLELSDIRIMIRRLSQEEIAQHSPAKSIQSPVAQNSPKLDEPQVDENSRRGRSRPQRYKASKASDPLPIIQDPQVETGVRSHVLDVNMLDENLSIIPAIDDSAFPVESDCELVDIHSSAFDSDREPHREADWRNMDRPSSAMSERRLSLSSVEPELEAVFNDGSSSPELVPAEHSEPDHSLPLDIDPPERLAVDLDVAAIETSTDVPDHGVKRSSNQASLYPVDAIWGDYVMKPKKLSGNDPLEGTSKKFKVKVPHKAIPSERTSSRRRGRLAAAIEEIEVVDGVVAVPSIETSPVISKVCEAPASEFLEPLPAAKLVRECISRTSARIRMKRDTCTPTIASDTEGRVRRRASSIPKTPVVAESELVERPSTRTSSRSKNTPKETASERSKSVPKRGGVEVTPPSEGLEKGEEKKRSSSDKENEVREKGDKLSTKKRSAGRPPSRRRIVVPVDLEESDCVSVPKRNQRKNSSQSERFIVGEQKSAPEWLPVIPMAGQLSNQSSDDSFEGELFPRPSLLEDTLFGSPNLYDRVKKRRTSTGDPIVSDLHVSISTLSQSDSSQSTFSDESNTKRRAASVMSFKEPSLKKKLRAPNAKKK